MTFSARATADWLADLARRTGAAGNVTCRPPVSASACAPHRQGHHVVYDAIAAAVPAGLARIAGAEPYDIIYADPPHAFCDFDALLEAISTAKLLAPDGLVILEHASRTAVPEKTGALNRVRQAAYGETTLSFYGAADQP